MAQEAPYLPLLTLYFVSLNFASTNPKSSTHWKLNVKEGKIQSALAADDTIRNDPLLSVLTGRMSEESSYLVREDSPGCGQDTCSEESRPKSHIPTKSASDTDRLKKKNPKTQPTRHCGTFVNLTDIDHLKGVQDRHLHPLAPEPEVKLIFREKDSNSPDGVDLIELEKRLKKTRKESPKSPQIYNQMANFWRVKGNALMAIECFRKSLYYKPRNPDVFLNLARLLFKLKYLDDAIYLTRRSMELQGSDQNTWLQHFTLAEIYQASGRTQDAIEHFRQALTLNPGFQPAEMWLKDLSQKREPAHILDPSTVIMIIVLTVGAGTVLFFGFIHRLPLNQEAQDPSVVNYKSNTRHFNRALAMRSMKLGLNHKLQRMRKQMAQAQ